MREIRAEGGERGRARIGAPLRWVPRRNGGATAARRYTPSHALKRDEACWPPAMEQFLPINNYRELPQMKRLPTVHARHCAPSRWPVEVAVHTASSSFQERSRHPRVADEGTLYRRGGGGPCRLVDSTAHGSKSNSFAGRKKGKWASPSKDTLQSSGRHQRASAVAQHRVTPMRRTGIVFPIARSTAGAAPVVLDIRS